MCVSTKWRVTGADGKSLSPWLQGVIHLVDTAGIAKPPLRVPGDGELQDLYVLAYRRGIAVDAGEVENL